MGLVVQEIAFTSPAPTAAAIAARVTELVGLPVIVRESPPEIRGTLYDLHAQIAFEAYPEAEVELTAYRAGAVREHMRSTGLDAMSFASAVQGARESVGKQTVYVQGYIGQEPTLLLATTVALEALGGRPTQAITDDERRNYARSVSSGELGRRHRQVQRQGLLRLTVGVLLLPILIPVWMIALTGYLVTMPRRVRKAQQSIKNHVPGAPPDGA